MLEKEYKAFDREYYRQAIAGGSVTVNGEQTTPERVVRDNDVLVHWAIKIEIPMYKLRF